MPITTPNIPYTFLGNPEVFKEISAQYYSKSPSKKLIHVDNQTATFLRDTFSYWNRCGLGLKYLIAVHRELYSRFGPTNTALNDYGWAMRSLLASVGSNSVFGSADDSLKFKLTNAIELMRKSHGDFAHWLIGRVELPVYRESMNLMVAIKIVYENNYYDKA